jgi:flagellar protein FlbD
VIRLTKLNHTEFILNSQLIESIEQTPDTLINLTTGKFVIVHETLEEVVERAIQYNKALFENILKIK